MDYMEILEELVGNPCLYEYLNEGDTVSALFIGMDSGKPLHMLLVMQPAQDGFVSAYAVGLESPAEAPVFAAEAEGLSMTEAELDALPMEQYAAIYPQVFELVSRPERTGEEEAVIHRYRSLLREDGFRKWSEFLKKQFPDKYWE